jgi:sugar fermentation stimulation protein A
MNLFFSFPKPCVTAVFLARPQRFLAQVKLADGATTLAYCANPGSFRGCLESGSPCLLWDSAEPQRKRRYTLRAVKLGRTWLGTDTHLANELIETALRHRLLPGLEKCVVLKREPRTRNGSRLDFLLGEGVGECFLEVKSATVTSGDFAQFPDSLSPRSVEHLNALINVVKTGRRAVLVFLIQRGDVEGLKINTACDPSFNRAFARARKAGVEFQALKHTVTAKGFGQPVPVPVLY